MGFEEKVVLEGGTGGRLGKAHALREKGTMVGRAVGQQTENTETFGGRGREGGRGRDGIGVESEGGLERGWGSRRSVGVLQRLRASGWSQRLGKKAERADA
jgi:hypothetical protein